MFLCEAVALDCFWHSLALPGTPWHSLALPGTREWEDTSLVANFNASAMPSCAALQRLNGRIFCFDMFWSSWIQIWDCGDICVMLLPGDHCRHIEKGGKWTREGSSNYKRDLWREGQSFSAKSLWISLNQAFRPDVSSWLCEKGGRELNSWRDHL